MKLMNVFSLSPSCIKFLFSLALYKSSHHYISTPPQPPSSATPFMRESTSSVPRSLDPSLPEA
jgi:hypothetical protein